VTELDLRVSTLAAVFAPERAPALLSRLSSPGAPGAALHAERLTGLPRRERLRALAAALAPDAAAVRAAAEDAACRERPRVAMLLTALGGDVAVTGVPGFMLRICRERIGR
jgi:hypothetical protein